VGIVIGEHEPHADRVGRRRSDPFAGTREIAPGVGIGRRGELPRRGVDRYFCLFSITFLGPPTEPLLAGGGGVRKGVTVRQGLHHRFSSPPIRSANKTVRVTLAVGTEGRDSTRAEYRILAKQTLKRFVTGRNNRFSLRIVPCLVCCCREYTRTGHDRASIARPNTPLRFRSNGKYAPKHAKYRAISTSTDERLEPGKERASTIAKTGQHPRLSRCFRRTRDSRCGTTGAVAAVSNTGGLENLREQAFSRACCRRSRSDGGAFQLDASIAATATSEPSTHCGAEHECYRPNADDNSGLQRVSCRPVCVTRRAPVDRHVPASSQSVTVKSDGP